MLRVLLACTFAFAGTSALADMKVSLGAPWDGKNIPAGQHCKLHGGNGSTPPMAVSGLPEGTTMVVVEYNDRSFKPLSRNGGHGTLAYPVKGDTANLPAVPGMTAKLPSGVRVVRKAQSTGDYASPGYLPPCSGGRGNTYEAVVKAVGSDGKVLKKAKVKLGRY